MLQILCALKTADAVVFASPVYYAGVTAQLKAAIDRTYADLKTGEPWGKGALLLTCGNPDTSIAEPTIVMYKKILSFNDREDGGVIVAPGIHGLGEIAGNPITIGS
jgi:multimeric flavodoxin WrbA